MKAQADVTEETVKDSEHWDHRDKGEWGQVMMDEQ